jgi:hypothetical protein
MGMVHECPGCQRVVRLAPGEIERILSQQQTTSPRKRVSTQIYESRLEICQSCVDLRYGTTCRYCGCLVAVRAALSDHACPAPVPKWKSVSDSDQTVP